jgi:hypothetical protein
MSSRGTSDKESPIGIVPGWSFASLYMFRSDFVCGRSEMIDCNDFLANHLWIQAFEAVGMFGTPG